MSMNKKRMTRHNRVMKGFGMENEVNMSLREETKPMSMADCLNRIMVKVRYENFTDAVVESLKDDFAYVNEKFGICSEEAALLSFVLESSSDFCRCDNGGLAEFLGCTNIEFISFRKHLQSLAHKRIVRIGKNRVGDATYQVMPEAYQAIVDNTVYTAKSFAGLSTEDMFSEFRKLFGAFRNDDIDNKILKAELDIIIDANPQNIFVQKLLECGIRKCTTPEQSIFLYLCHQYVSWGNKQVSFQHLDKIIGNYDDGQKFFRFFQAGKHGFQKRGLVGFGGDEGFMDKRSMALSDEVRKTFFTEVELFCEETITGHTDVMSCDSIKIKEMFYNAPELEQIQRLEELLKDTHFNGIQARLDEMGMRKGFNIILYGAPGTGKTETTLQLAKKSGRDVFCIDVSKLKSKWVGDSEKAMREVFNIYRNLCKSRKRKPILFFNEADAIFGKRLENVESSAAQMLNTLQNILLQEMETLDGILICTTNLHGNLDSAFERRFIYKVELEKPSEEVRSKIWKSMLPGYSDEDYAFIGRKYHFSGGQIENVVRKSMVDYILYGNKVSLETICKFCEEEVFKSKVKKVGF